MPPYLLIVDDDAFLTTIFQKKLTREGREIGVAHSGAEAIQSIENRQPSALVLDLLMPSGDGFSVLQHIRDKNYAFPVLVVSNVQNDEDEKRCLELGAKGFYSKTTTDLEDLAKTVDSFLSH